VCRAALAFGEGELVLLLGDVARTVDIYAVKALLKQKVHPPLPFLHNDDDAGSDACGEQYSERNLDRHGSRVGDGHRALAGAGRHHRSRHLSLTQSPCEIRPSI
jgi:hypothetical protein